MSLDVTDNPPNQNPNSGRNMVLWVLLIALAVFVIIWLSSQFKRKRIFISFAASDARYRDFLREQSENDRSPFEFTDMSVQKPFPDSWKTRCHERIKGCDGMIVLLSRKTWRADGARWEMKCAKEEGVPVLGVHIRKKDKGAIPPELRGKRVIEWSWDGIKEFLDRIP